MQAWAETSKDNGKKSPEQSVLGVMSVLLYIFVVFWITNLKTQTQNKSDAANHRTEGDKWSFISFFLYGETDIISKMILMKVLITNIVANPVTAITVAY